MRDIQVVPPKHVRRAGEPLRAPTRVRILRAGTSKVPRLPAPGRPALCHARSGCLGLECTPLYMYHLSYMLPKLPRASINKIEGKRQQIEWSEQTVSARYVIREGKWRPSKPRSRTPPPPPRPASIRRRPPPARRFARRAELFFFRLPATLQSTEVCASCDFRL